jgi:hypothetical protein
MGGRKTTGWIQLRLQDRFLYKYFKFSMKTKSKNNKGKQRESGSKYKQTGVEME